MKIGIIGAGIGGLSAACLLAADGHEVILWEKNDTVGGKMNQKIVDGYRFDTGPSLFTMPDILRSVFEACNRTMEDYITIKPVDPVCRYFWRDGTVFDCSTNIPVTLENMRKFAPEDTEAYISFLGYSADIYKKTSNTFLFNPLQQLKDLRDVKKSDIFKIDAFSSVSTKVDKYFKSPYIRQFFKRFTTYNGSSPYIAPATLNVIPYVELCLGGYYVHGGLYQIAASLEKLAQELGVTIQFGKCVKQITSNNQKAEKVVFEDGEEVAIDILFSNSDATHTYTELLNDKTVKPRNKQQLREIEPSCSGFVLLLGINKKFDELKHHSIFFSDDYENEFRELFIKKRPSENPTIYIANTSHSDPEHAVEGGSNLFILVNTPYLTDETVWTPEYSKKYGDMIISILEKEGLSGLRESIQVREHITPQDFYDVYLSNKGSIYGTSSNLPTSAFMRPRNKSPFLNNLYLTGGSTHPGGGIPLVVLSAKHAVFLFKRDKVSLKK